MWWGPMLSETDGPEATLQGGAFWLFHGGTEGELMQLAGLAHTADARTLWGIGCGDAGRQAHRRLSPGGAHLAMATMKPNAATGGPNRRPRLS
jgi:hypothetical protein